MDRLDSLVVEQIPRLRRYARALMGNSSRADDLVQDCLERAWSRIHQWQPGSDMRAWLFAIMHSVYVNNIRHHRSRPQFVSMDGEELTVGVDPPQESSLELRDLAAGLAALPLEQREVLLLVALEGLSYQEVAKILDLPLGTVMSRLHRARERLRSWMAGTPENTLRIAR